MEVKMEIPVILEDQKEVMDWVRKLRANRINWSTIIESLITEGKSLIRTDEDELEKMRKLYKGKNGAWREQLLRAIMIDNYRFQNDIKEGQIVSDGTYVGYAFSVDYKSRNFELYSLNKKNVIGFVKKFKMDGFKKYK